jgi:hypothetical protein
MNQDIKHVSEMLQTVTKEEFERRVQEETNLERYPITSKEMMSLLRNRYRKLKRFYNVVASN